MTLTIDEADEIAEAVGILGISGTLLWMNNNIGEASTEQMVSDLEHIVTSIAMPSFKLVLFLLAASFVYSIFADF
ncbi:hypothetical protein [Haloarcula argentinensis]|uniref:Uncharacterized protein n=1 Tax=Haloarcula argentinensis TaxID=43776 RepID=A0A847UMZ8_HALAR|nr:hypothetical protein [Haloarcula argentinensis]NLV12598.1 hypothetical protein [Haloarcula argentinensis]